MNRGPLMHALREGTAPQHRRLEATTPFDSQSPTTEGYRAHLEALARVHPPLELALDAAHDWQRLGLSDWPGRRRAALLEADLRALGAPPAVPAPAPDVEPLPRAVGCLYVLEGSLLGGQLVAKRLQEAGLGALPTRYLLADGVAPGPRFASFCAFAETLAAGEPGFIARAVAGAAGCFDALAAAYR